MGKKAWTNNSKPSSFAKANIVATTIRGLFNTSLDAQVAAIFRKHGSNAHAYIPGVGWTSGFQAGNFIESTGQTNASVDNPVGLVLDAAGSVGADLCTATVINSAQTIILLPGAGPFSGRSFEVMNAPAGLKWHDGTGVYSLNGLARQVVKLNPGATGLNLYQATGSALDISSVTVKEITGTHATQSTTANKPTLRRGIVNLLQYSNDVANVVWTKVGSPTVSGGFADPFGGSSAQKLTRTVASESYIHQAYTKAAAALPFTCAAIIKLDNCRYGSLRWQGTYPNRVDAVFDLQTGTVYNATVSGTFTTPVGTIAPLGNGFYLCAVSAVSDTSTGSPVMLSFSQSIQQIDGTDTVSNSSGFHCDIGIFQGTLTAQQILDYGGIPLTTTAPASSSRGPFAWQFDGSNDVLTAPAVVQASDDYFECVGVTMNTDFSGYPFISSAGANSSGVGRLGDIYVNADGTIGGRCVDDSGTPTFYSSTVTVSRGVPFVVSASKKSGFITTNVNGVDSGAIATVSSGITVNSSSLGSNGAMRVFGRLLIKGTLSSAEEKTLRKWIAQRAGVVIS